jgi:hypothetical protein
MESAPISPGIPQGGERNARPCALSGPSRRIDAVISPSIKLLLVEDERKVASFIKQGLTGQLYTVDVAYDGMEGDILDE